MVGEGGYGLSGGQAQRIAIARAFLKNAPLLLLDEPTAHLDPATESEVFDGLRRLAAGRTVILASHSAAARAFSGRRLDIRTADRARESGGTARVSPVIADMLRVIGLWRGQRAVAGGRGRCVLLALSAGIGLMVAAGAALASLALFAPLALRGLGAARVVLRYVERLVTHTAMFRALADLRVWLFRRLAANSAGGLGFRQAGDVLSRLVNDVEALDGVYLRVLVPLAGAVLLLPVALLLMAPRTPLLAAVIGVLFVLAAFVLPWRAARTAAESGTRLAVSMGQLRVAVLDTMTGWREVRAFGAEGRMLASVQAREAAVLGAQHTLATRTALAGRGRYCALRRRCSRCFARRGPIRLGPSSRHFWCSPRSRSLAACPERARIWVMPRRRRIGCWRQRTRPSRCPTPRRPLHRRKALGWALKA